MPIFQAVKLPAGIAGLDTSLANVHGDALTQGCCFADQTDGRGEEEVLFLTGQLLGS